PYAALPAAVLAQHAGVFHTHPEIVFVPQDPLFGPCKEDLKCGLFLYEERPAGENGEIESFGNSEKIVSTDEVISNTMESEDYEVDQYAVLRARLLDVYINDWDRHDDQWRWASFTGNDKTIYRPIPRNRDKAFFVNQGILPGIASKDFILPKLQNFQPRTNNVAGLGCSSRYFDRTFLNQMEWKDWESMTDDLMEKMTEEVIDEAMAAFPEEVQSLCADTTKSILLARKEYMKGMANELYMFISREVDVVGTDKKDLFEIERKNNHETVVKVSQINIDGTNGKQIFERTFYTLETKEINCYGLEDEDRFEITGGVNYGPIVRVIGGPDKDEVIDHSLVGGFEKRNKIYDLRKNTTIDAGKESIKFLSNNKIVHEFDRKEFQNDLAMPLAYLGYNADDGVFLGYGRMWYYQKFRREWRSSVLGDLALKTLALNVKYKFESLSTNNGLDYIFGLDVISPNYTNNYYGLGNETKNEYLDYNYKYFRNRQQRYLVGLGIQKRFGQSVWTRYDKEDLHKEQPINEHKVGLVLKWNLTNTQEQENKFITNFEENGLTSEDLLRKQFVILNANYQYKNVNKEFCPSRGIVVNAKAERFMNVEGNYSDFTKVGTSAISYLSFNKYPRMVYTFRLGGEKVFGDYFFREAVILDGNTNLRGYRKTRFYGDGSLYFNAEARFKLYDFKNYLLNGEIGLLAFDDIGRVWLEGEGSKKWHNGYGAGIWVSPFKRALFTTTLNMSKEETLLQVK
ncbi:outer membrane protein assembly factor, partial [Draconibacterium sp.]|nr:outer membrane protein assembly factor [Draconibacterium sp.]